MESNNSLLSFVNIASSNIQEALGKAPKRRRNVTVKKFVENRVKRLDSSRRVRTGTFNRSKSAQLKRPAAPAATVPSSVTSMLPHSNTCPEFNIIPVSLPHPVTTQSSGIPTCAYPTTTPVSLYSGAESTVCLPPQHPSATATQPIDPELESLLSELEGNNLSRHGSFDSVCTGTLSSTPPINTLETQVYLGEQMFSPYSDYSDELDSAYCSPVGIESTRVSYNSSPTNLPNWVDVADMLPPVSSSCLQEMEMSRCSNWENTPLTTTATSTSSSSLSIYDQGPPMTPTVSQLLQQYNQY